MSSIAAHDHACLLDAGRDRALALRDAPPMARRPVDLLGETTGPAPRLAGAGEGDR